MDGFNRFHAFRNTVVNIINAGGLLTAICLISSIGSATSRPLEPAAMTPDAITAFGGLAVQIDRAALPTRESFMLEHVPLDSHTTVTLEVERFEVLEPDAPLLGLRHDEDGAVIEIELPRPTMHLLRGTVLGEDESHVFLALGDRGANGWIQRAGSFHVLTTHRQEGWTTIYDLNAVDPDDMHWADMQCATVGVPQPAPQVDPTDTPRGDLSCKALRVAVETDWEYTGLFGGDSAAATEYAMTLLAAASSVYDRDIGIAVTMSYLRLWLDNDDPWSGADSGAQLSQFQGHWSSQMNHVDRHIAHFLSGRGLGGGIAYLNGVCNNLGYAVSGNLGGSFPMPLEDNNGGNWDPMVVMHEIGHNCGSGHTHDSYSPPIDGCGSGDCTDANLGTIMSYCHLCSGGLSNMSMRFHPEVQLVIENYLNTGISCELAGDGSPPVAVADIVPTLLGETVDISVLTNDYTNDCSEAMLDTWDTVSNDGLPVELVDDDVERALFRYVAPTESIDSGDIFNYSIIDASGQPDDGAVLIVYQQARAADTPAAVESGTIVDYYDLDTPQTLPDFDQLEPYLSEIVPDIDYPSTNGNFAGSGLNDDFGCVFRGFIEVPTSGWYTLYTNSDDGSALYIGEQQVVENDGLHGMRERSGTIALQAGRHAIRVEFFERGGGAGCIVSIEGDGLDKQVVPDAMWSHEVQLPGDTNGDATIDVLDLLQVILDWGQCPTEGDCLGDLDGSGVVDVEDLLLVIGAWS